MKSAIKVLKEYIQHLESEINSLTLPENQKDYFKKEIKQIKKAIKTLKSKSPTVLKKKDLKKLTMPKV